jgi:hypothetical protein
MSSSLKFSSAVEYQPILSLPIDFYEKSVKVTYLLNFKAFKSSVKTKTIYGSKEFDPDLVIL